MWSAQAKLALFLGGSGSFRSCTRASSAEAPLRHGRAKAPLSHSTWALPALTFGLWPLACFAILSGSAMTGTYNPATLRVMQPTASLHEPAPEPVPEPGL